MRERKSFYDGAKPFVLIRYRDEITFSISMFTIAYSGLMMLRLQPGIAED